MGIKMRPIVLDLSSGQRWPENQAMMTVNIFIKDCMIVYFLICLRMKLEKEVPGLELDVLDGVLVGEEEGEQGDVQGNTDHQVGDVHLYEDKRKL